MSTIPASTDPVITQSARFNDESADFVLISSDNVKFSVHRANLSTGSSVFKDMLEIGESSNKGNKDEIRLEEDSATLEAVLPYFYSNSIGVIKVTDFAFILKMINCGDKYQIERCLNAIREGFWHVHSTARTRQKPNFSHYRVATSVDSQASDQGSLVKQLLYGFDFASRFNEVELRDVILGQLESKPIGIIADSCDEVLCASLPTAGLLQNLMSRHAKDSKCRDEATDRLISAMDNHSGCSSINANKVYRLWNESTSDLSKFRVGGTPVFTWDCYRCHLAVQQAFNILARSL